MLIDIKPLKKVRDAVIENQKIVDNHKKAAMHHEAAAIFHHEAARHQMSGNKDQACGCNVKAIGETKLASKAQKKNLKKHETV